MKYPKVDLKDSLIVLVILMKSDQTINFLIVSDILQMDMSLVIHQCKDVVSFVATNVSNQFKQVLKKKILCRSHSDGQSGPDKPRKGENK